MTMAPANEVAVTFRFGDRVRTGAGGRFTVTVNVLVMAVLPTGSTASQLTTVLPRGKVPPVRVPTLQVGTMPVSSGSVAETGVAYVRVVPEGVVATAVNEDGPAINGAVKSNAVRAIEGGGGEPKVP